MASIAKGFVFEIEMDGVITADVYVGQRKIATPGDRIEIGQLSRGQKTLCRLNGTLYWIENSAWDADAE